MSIGRVPGATGIQPSIVDAKGDLIVATAADSVDRLAVGTNEQRLVADSAAATGLKYVADTTNYAIAAKGDLLVGTAADTLAALTVGSANQVLTVDSSTATGLKWAALPSSTPTFVGCMLYSDATQSIPNNTITAVQFAAADYIDTDNFHSPTVNNSRITIPAGKSGKYFVYANALHDNAPVGNNGRTIIYLNGTAFSEEKFTFSSGDETFQVSAIMNLVAGDYVEFFVSQSSGGANNIYGTTANTVRATCFGVALLGA